MTQHAHPEGGPAPEPKVIKLDPTDLAVMLGQLLAAQAETAATQKRLLEIEVAKQEAQQRKDADAQARLERERKQLHEQMQIYLENKELRIRSCNHKDQRGGSTIYVVSNHPDRRPRGVCSRCPIYIEPEHYEVDAFGRHVLVDEHPLYKTVIQRDQDLYSEFVPTTSY